MKYIYLFLFIIYLLLYNFSQARPISYENAWTAMIENNSDKNSFYIHYSPTVNYSIGYKLEYWREADYTINATQLNNLLYRSNQKRSQANLYLKSGVGVANCYYASCDNKTTFAFYTGIAADWETQRYFISYENRYINAQEIDKAYMESARIGIAPYVGEFGDLHTWLMLQLDHTPNNEEKWTLTPLLRFFKGTNLAEVGVNLRGKLLFNFIKRF